MTYKIYNIEKPDYPEVIEVWEASVRATHHFLKEEDIQEFKPLILQHYLDAVNLKGVRNEAGKIIGFLGVADEIIEMLFLHPMVLGQGIGKFLMQYAINELNATHVDVNEDNAQAVGFYLHLGFKVISRSKLDPMGKPYPVLHMVLV